MSRHPACYRPHRDGDIGLLDAARDRWAPDRSCATRAPPPVPAAPPAGATARGSAAAPAPTACEAPCCDHSGAYNGTDDDRAARVRAPRRDDVCARDARARVGRR